MYHRWSSSNLSPYASSANSVFSLVIICCTLAGRRIRCRPYAPPFSRVCASTESPAAVENTPACPATPLNDHAISSCTSPHTIPGGGAT